MHTIGHCCLVGGAKNQQDWALPLKAKMTKNEKPQTLAGILYLALCHAACFYIFGCHFFFSWKRLLSWAHSHGKRQDCQLQQSKTHSMLGTQLGKHPSTEHHKESKEIKISFSTWLLLCCMNSNTRSHLCLSARQCAGVIPEESEVLVGSIFPKVAKGQVTGAPAALRSMLSNYHPGKSRGTGLYHNQDKRQSQKLQRHHCLPLDLFPQQGNHGSNLGGP